MDSCKGRFWGGGYHIYIYIYIGVYMGCKNAGGKVF